MSATIFEQGAPGRRAFVAPDFDVPEAPDALPESVVSSDITAPRCSVSVTAPRCRVSVSPTPLP